MESICSLSLCSNLSALQDHPTWWPLMFTVYSAGSIQLFSISIWLCTVDPCWFMACHFEHTNCNLFCQLDHLDASNVHLCEHCTVCTKSEGLYTIYMLMWWQFESLSATLIVICPLNSTTQMHLLVPCHFENTTRFKCNLSTLQVHRYPCSKLTMWML